MSEFEEFVRTQGFSGDFQRGCNGQYKSDLLHFMEKAFMHQQAKIDELKMSNHHLSVQLVDSNAHYDHVKKERDELQARVDEALTYLRHTNSRECKESILFNILKGNKDD